MDTPLLTLFVAETLAFALLWHNKPARPQQEFAGLARFLRWLRLHLRFRKMIPYGKAKNLDKGSHTSGRLGPLLVTIYHRHTAVGRARPMRMRKVVS